MPLSTSLAENQSLQVLSASANVPSPSVPVQTSTIAPRPAWQVVRKEGGGGRHEQERRKFLRIQVLREVTLSARQAIGLEPWGRMKVEYEGLEASLGWIQTKARRGAKHGQR